jgi:heme A synthase
VTRLPDSPDDRASRNELLRRIGVRLLVALVPTVLIGALAVGLGVPVWIVLAICVVIIAFVLFDA